MSEDMTPETEPECGLVPPIRRPPTAVAAAASPPPPRPPMLPRMPRSSVPFIGAMVERVLDTLDLLGDTIASAAGIRSGASTRDA